ncbi:enoyl-CoA hydratase/isomerase [Spartinivicinus poritis]|uniref:Enoyl-CoA hydratase/isomerase n=1 Tax=Spartinivicinus poritis TaxID=2994640 RepID=A0ABT5U874_9GAMM|nr:enoyl-CoA hydratase/isomerase [Spartinivicinus sp. A2-2]MDE1462564.1 enoyl-CoA hydratase/isomerase [Spartinivicinus sp. A2-2]
MGEKSSNQSTGYQTLNISTKDDLCFIQLYRPEAKNTLNDLLIEEFRQALLSCHSTAKILIIEGLSDIFCFGADLQALANTPSEIQSGPEPLYDLWYQLTTGPFVTVAHVRGKANAGGVGFVAACDLVLADSKAEFSLPELLFGLMPACVLPFLIRRIGYQKAHAMTLMTKPISSEEAYRWGLVDAYAEDSQALLNQHLLRLRRLSKTAIGRYKNYLNKLDVSLAAAKPNALAANQVVFSDPNNLSKINRYVNTGQFPWEA